jgi:hypothetical protein
MGEPKMQQTYELIVVSAGTNKIVQSFPNATLPFSAINSGDLWNTPANGTPGEVIGVSHTIFEQQGKRHQRTTILVGAVKSNDFTDESGAEPVWPHASVETAG